MYYLIEHNRTTKTTNCDEYKDYQNARRACFEKEQQYVLEKKDEIEVVVFEADSLEDLKVKRIRIQKILLLLLVWLPWRYIF